MEHGDKSPLQLLLRKACAKDSGIESELTKDLLDLPGGLIAEELTLLLADSEVFSAECSELFFEAGAMKTELAGGMKSVLPFGRLYELTQRLIDCLGSRDPVALGLIADIYSQTVDNCKNSGGVGHLEFRQHLQAVLTQILAELRAAAAASGYTSVPQEEASAGFGDSLRGVFASLGLVASAPEPGVPSQEIGALSQQNQAATVASAPSTVVPTAPQAPTIRRPEAETRVTEPSRWLHAVPSTAAPAPAADVQVTAAALVVHRPEELRARDPSTFAQGTTAAPVAQRPEAPRAHDPGNFAQATVPAPLDQGAKALRSILGAPTPADEPQSWAGRMKHALLCRIDNFADSLDSVFAPNLEKDLPPQATPSQPTPAEAPLARDEAKSDAPSRLLESRLLGPPSDRVADGHVQGAITSASRANETHHIQHQKSVDADIGVTASRANQIHHSKPQRLDDADIGLIAYADDGHIPCDKGGGGALQRASYVGESHSQKRQSGHFEYVESKPSHDPPRGHEGVRQHADIERATDFTSAADFGNQGEIQDVLAPSNACEDEIDAMLIAEGAGRDGLPAYVAVDRTWEPRQLVLGSGGRYLYVMEEGESYSNSFFSEQLESPCFELQNLRKVTRRSSPGWHLLSLQFEEGNLVLRFSYVELQAGLLRALTANRRVPVVEMR